MIEAIELNQNAQAGETKEEKLNENPNSNHYPKNPKSRSYLWWLRIAMYTLFVLSGQTVATLLGRLYFDKGGNSKWMSTLVQLVGFPVLIPLMLISPNPKTLTLVSETGNSQNRKKPSLLALVSLYTSLGVFIAAYCMLYSIGLLYLPVSTYSLICATQIAFNALFSYFLNAQKFTPFIINSLILLTVSSALLVFTNDSSSDSNSNKLSKGKYMIGFICTVGASAGYSLTLSVTQLAFVKIIKKENFRMILEILIYEGVVSSCAILVGLFASGDWKGLNKEMNDYELGKWSYIMTLVWIAILWQVFSIGTLGLIIEFSSLFSNVISAFGLPIIPVLAIFIFHDKMDGLKIISMLLAIWGVISYVYQNYLDDKEMTIVAKKEVSEISLIEIET